MRYKSVPRRFIGRRRGSSFQNLYEDPFTRQQKFKYLLSCLLKIKVIPDEDLLKLCLAQLTAREKNKAVRGILKTAKARSFDVKDIERDFKSRVMDSDEAMDEFFYGKKSLRPIIYRHIMELLKEKAAAPAPDPAKSGLLEMLENLSSIFGLNEVEIEIIYMFYLYDTDDGFSNLVDVFQRCFNIKSSSFNYSISEKTMGCFTGSGYSEINRALSRNSRINRLELLDESGGLAMELRLYLMGQGENPITDTYFTEVKEYELGMDKFTIPDTEKETLLRLIRGQKNDEKLNILFFGLPGTGKTQLSNTIGHHLGLKVYSINNTQYREDGFRMRALLACQNMVELDKSLIIMDEADEIIETCGNFFEGKAQGDKSKINTTLDNSRGAVIWITNHWENVDESTLRRFDYSINFPGISFSQRKNIWNTQLDKVKTRFKMNEEDIEKLTDKYEVNPGGIAFAVNNALRIHRKGCSREQMNNTLHNLLSSHVKLVYGEKALGANPSEPNAVNYSLEGLNIKGNIHSVIKSLSTFADKMETGSLNKNIRNMNLLMYGPPGTGKTEFARYISRTLKKRLVIKSASDLLSMWVGQSEKTIRNSFELAERDKAILFFDEVDGLLASREGAMNSWEVTQVNEILTRMEQYRGIFICATNFNKHVDKAAMRRFNFKIRFDYLDSKGTEIFYKRILGSMVHEPLREDDLAALRNIRGLTPGDFKVVYQGHAFIDAEELTHEELVYSLREETENKELKGMQKMGF